MPVRVKGDHLEVYGSPQSLQREVYNKLKEFETLYGIGIRLVDDASEA